MADAEAVVAYLYEQRVTGDNWCTQAKPEHPRVFLDERDYRNVQPLVRQDD